MKEETEEQGEEHNERQEEEEKKHKDARMEESERDGVPGKMAKSFCKYLRQWEEVYLFLMKSITVIMLFVKCATQILVCNIESDVSQHDKLGKHKHPKVLRN